jgi:hypothetical protein
LLRVALVCSCIDRHSHARAASRTTAGRDPPLRLAIRAIIAAYIGAFVPVQPKPTQVVFAILLGISYISLLIGIFDAQNKYTLLLAGK